jgi:tetratricopeptide (TPR) repeat protein
MDDAYGAEAAATEATQQFLAAGNRSRAALSQEVIGELRADKGDLEGAENLFESSLATFRELGEMRGTGAALGDIVIIEKRLEHYDVARDRAEASSKIDFAQSPQERAINLYNYAELLLLVGDLPAARAKQEEGLALRRAAGDRRGTVMSLLLGAEIALAQGELAVAQRMIGEARETPLKEPRVRALLAMTAGRAALESGHPEPAIADVAGACATHHEGKRLAEEASCTSLQVRMLVAAGKRAEALSVLDGAASLLTTSGDRRSPRVLAVEDAYVRGLAGSGGAAIDALARLDESVAHSHEVHTVGDELDARLARALLARAKGRPAPESLATIADDAAAHGFTSIAVHAHARRR